MLKMVLPPLLSIWSEVMTILSAKHVGKSFRRGQRITEVLSGASVNVSEGEFVTILGPSGSGKSTFLNICGLIEPLDHGELSFRGSLLSNMTERQRTEFRRQHLGFIFQQFNLVPVMSVFDNVALPLMLLDWSAPEKRARVLDVLDRVGLADFAQAKPEVLSGGQCQRVAVARALVKSPAVIIADEPTASLDSTSALQVITQMKALASAQGTACLIATHDARLLPYSDTVLELDSGKVKTSQQKVGPVNVATGMEGVV
jgi:putative ABC transport system ATP-binding protein